METLWATVDRLIHDLGAIRAFIDEAEAVAGASAAPDLTRVRGAMDAATGAITRVFDHPDDATIEGAWEAIARAQDAVREARSRVAHARAARETAEGMAQQARAQLQRAREQAEAMAEQSDRLRQAYRAATKE